MADYPYTTVPGKISPFFSKIQQTGVPDKVTEKWLKSIGFSSSNDRTLLRILRFIGFVDSSGAPTGYWRDYRGARSKQILADCIRSSYSRLFSTYPSAYSCERETLDNFFSGYSSADKQVISKITSTFLELCKLADFASLECQPASRAEAAQGTDLPDTERGRASCPLAKGVTINVNIQLVLPEGADANTYEELLSAMSKYLLHGDV